MPHVVMTGPIGPEDIWMAFEPTEFGEDGVVFKAQDCYLATDKSELLIRSLVVERGFTKAFFVKIAGKGEAITINLEPLAGPERTDAVKRLIGLFAWRIMQVEPQMTIEKTNVEELIKAPG